jgi:Ca2+-binding EF-hand superfamily protein
VYTLFDYDENGTISTNQLGTVMRALGVNPSDSEVQDIVNEIDVEGLYILSAPFFNECGIYTPDKILCRKLKIEEQESH